VLERTGACRPPTRYCAAVGYGAAVGYRAALGYRAWARIPESKSGGWSHDSSECAHMWTCPQCVRVCARSRARLCARVRAPLCARACAFVRAIGGYWRGGRAGHTEASVDFARLAGCSAVGVICELVASDGTGRMARRDDLVAFAQVSLVAPSPTRPFPAWPFLRMKKGGMARRDDRMTSVAPYNLFQQL
jgi:hypothetical protein